MSFPIARCVPLVLFLPFATLSLPLNAVPGPAGQIVPAPAGIYFTDPAATELDWKVDHRHLADWTARFEAPEVTLDWRPEAPETSRLIVRIDPVTVRSGVPWPDVAAIDARIARDPEFLDGRIITFVSTAIERTGERTARIHGRLTLRGETHPLVLEAVLGAPLGLHPESGAPQLGFTASGRFRRSDWGMDALAPVIADEVEITVRARLAPGLV